MSKSPGKFGSNVQIAKFPIRLDFGIQCHDNKYVGSYTVVCWLCS